MGLGDHYTSVIRFGPEHAKNKVRFQGLITTLLTAGRNMHVKAEFLSTTCTFAQQPCYAMILLILKYKFAMTLQ